MKCLLLNQTFYPDRAATSHLTYDLARFLVNEGLEVTVLADRRAYGRPNVIYPRREVVDGIRIERVSSTGFGKSRFWRRILDALTFDFFLVLKLLTTPKHDIVIGFTSPPLIGVFGTLFCWLRGGRSVQWLMDVNPDAAMAMGFVRRESTIGKALTWVLRLSLRRSDCVVVLDRWMKNRIAAKGIEEKNIAILPPWTVSEISSPVAALNPDDSPFRRKHGLAGKFIVLFLGNHSLVHPMDTLLDGMVALKDDPSVIFVFMGEGLRVPDVTRAKERHGLTNVLQLPPQPRETLKDCLASANLHVVIMGTAVAGLVHTSKIYGILASGAPYVFIGPRDSHVGDLLEICPYGFRVEHGEAPGLVEVIRRVQGFTPETLETFARKNTEHVRRYYTAEKVLSDFREKVLRRFTNDETPAALAR